MNDMGDIHQEKIPECLLKYYVNKTCSKISFVRS